mmetsp:Transcript_12806/g.23089  ORF Transcript_12806/g.23089 Transcript_12806/m.23089 type:complete len:326 (-) Transcript_12806:509-1486(-)
MAYQYVPIQDEQPNKRLTAGLVMGGVFVTVSTAAVLLASADNHRTPTGLYTTSRPITTRPVQAVVPKVVSGGFSQPIQLPLGEASAHRVMGKMLAPSAQVEDYSYPVAAQPNVASNPLAMVAAFALFLSGWAFKRPITPTTWSMAMAGDDEDFDAKLDALKSKGFGKVEKPASAPKPKEGKPLAAAVVKEEPAENFDDEELFLELKPSPSELVVPIIGSLFIIGLIPLATGVVRQLWVRFKVTSRRVSITSGWGGTEQTEVSYKKIKSMKYVRRSLGADGDLVMELTNGGAVDMQGVPQFPKVYNYIYDRVSPEVQAASAGKIKE